MKIYKKSLLICLFFCVLVAQDIQSQAIEQPAQKGKLFVQWGYNRGWFTNSDISFKGPDHDFTLSNVTASDRPTSFDFNTYFNPGKISTPQFNFRLGYFLSDHYSLSFGMDHMKYVVDKNQIATINGEIQALESGYAGTYENENIRLANDFLLFEHTDGLNYFNFELRRIDRLFDFNFITINFTEGVGIGGLFPRTDVSLLGMERHNKFHLSGYGINATVGLNVGFLKHLFIQSELKGGFINMPDIHVSESGSDQAKQNFFFLEWATSVGAVMRI